MADKDFSIYSFYQFESINGKLQKTDVAFERNVRRWFSKELGVSFSDTFKTPWTDIISHYYDHQISELDYNDVYNMAIDAYVPEVLAEEERLNQEYANSLVKEQKETLRKKKERDNPAPTSKAPDTQLKPESCKEDIKKLIKQLENQNIDKNKPQDVEMSFEMPEPDEDL